jgi:hypothetical protein
VVTENGVVRLEGIATEMSDITRAVMLARRAAEGQGSTRIPGPSIMAGIIQALTEE